MSFCLHKPSFELLQLVALLFHAPLDFLMIIFQQKITVLFLTKFKFKNEISLENEIELKDFRYLFTYLQKLPKKQKLNNKNFKVDFAIFESPSVGTHSLWWFIISKPFTRFLHL